MTPGYQAFLGQQGVDLTTLSPLTLTLMAGYTNRARLTGFAVGSDGTKYQLGLRANTVSYVSALAGSLIELVARSGTLVVRPASPTITNIAAIASGNVYLRWRHLKVVNTAPVSAFEIFTDAGTGTVNWITAIATVDSQLRHTILSGLTLNVPHLIGIRALAESGISDGNTVTLSVIPRSYSFTGLSSFTLKQV